MGDLTKYLWIDVETTGLTPGIHTIHQISGEIVVDGISVEEFDLKMRPFEKAVIDPEALAVSGLTVEEVMARPLSSKDAYVQFDKMLSTYVNKFAKKGNKEKYIICAYNAAFDAQHASGWYLYHGNKYFFGLCHGGAYFDPLQLALLYEMKMGKRVFIPDRKLVSVAKHFGIPLSEAHDAKHDITATRAVAKRLYQLIIGS